MGLYLFYARVNRSKAEEYNYLSVAELEEKVTNWFKDYIQSEPNQEDSSGSKEEVLYYSILAYWTTRSALKSLFSAIANDSFFLKCSELFVLLPHLEPEARAEFQLEVIDKFVDGTDFVLVEW